MNRIGVAALISVNNAAARTSSTFGNTSVRIASVGLRTPRARRMSNAPTRCCPSRMDAETTSPLESFEPFFFRAPPPLTFAVPSAMEMTPGMQKPPDNSAASFAFSSAIVSARSARNARCWSYTATRSLEFKGVSWS
jgi:hypothetical protein